MLSDWFGTQISELGFIVISAVAIVAWGVLMIRVVGLRSLSKMSSFDFVITVALGSVVATVAATSASLAHGALAFSALLGVQWAVSRLRMSTDIGDSIDNQPLLLMDGPEVLEENLRTARVSKQDLVAKLREANVTDVDQVLAVVLEQTGDVSVLHGVGPLDDRLLLGVRRG